MSKFADKVKKVVKQVPFGRVVSYGQVALYMGVPRAARQVGWILNRFGREAGIPWWRIVNNEGRISIKNFKYSALDQKKLLEMEGVKIGDDLRFNIEKYRYLPNVKKLQELEIDGSYLGMISQDIKYSRYFR